MAATRPILLGNLAITVKELTVGEVRDWLTEMEAGPGEDAVHALALPDCSLADLARMSDVSVQALEAYTPTELAELVTTCKELNPHFFKVRAALTGVARMMLTEAAALTSTRPPAFS